MSLKPMKNLLVLSFGILFLYTAYTGLKTLQSSLNDDEGLGVASLSVMYGALTISSMFLPAILMKKLGCKWTIVASMFFYISFTLGNFYPSWPTLITTSILLGIGGAPLWAAKSAYITSLGSQYAEIVGKATKDVVNHYFGIFFFICHTCRIWGNLISALIFNLSPNAGESLGALNQTTCGAGFCPIQSLAAENITGPSLSNTVLYTLLGCYTGCGVIAVLLIAIFLDTIKTKEETEQEKTQTICSMFFETFKHLKDKRQCLLIPLTLFSGLEQGFITGDFTRDYVTCAIGIRMVGFVIISFGVTNAIFPVVFGKLSQYTGRISIVLSGAFVQIACIIALLLWKPHSGQIAVFFVISGIWGIADAIWQTQISSLYGILFEKNKEAAFANVCLWESIGFVIAFGYSTFLCVSVKLYILLSVIVIAIILYAVVEYIEYQKPSTVVEKEPNENSSPIPVAA
ncbi:protein unc-93 homolog A-like [Bombina bombina]|uniref:protein unc-93 homolog A-like n=1 Tax=Bombina bombina TaxID=8345 RepID=UPI00235A8C5A|nr:protein unc-93 homolog A-like [Bombina bombina]